MKLAGCIIMSQDSFVKRKCFLMFLFLFNHDTEAIELRVKSFREKRVTCVLRVAQARSLMVWISRSNSLLLQQYKLQRTGSSGLVPGVLDSNCSLQCLCHTVELCVD